MNLEEIRAYCLSLPYVKEEVKWGNDLCFTLAGNMFFVSNLKSTFCVSLKINDEDFAPLSNKPNVIPAPYLARYKWIQITNEHVFSLKEWETRISESYELIKSGLSKKLLDLLD